ncbi:hypothetical protein [Pseudomonas sp. 2995-1]|uniref:hypothetical protein n=1 Tax=Pseudomonas TaxID=286 RepID=UPI000C14C28D|nr:hypothetical protein [Pseudomonas sp. 2995-1]PIB52695.1 hypothetical protein AOA61_23650 [Pseudomonas sp. 2995-1]
MPSKLLEYAATGKPILAGLGGYSKRFTIYIIPNASVFALANPDAVAAALAKVTLGTTDRAAFIQEYYGSNVQ